MSSRKDKELKDFLITVRKTHSPKLSDAPIWVIQKAGRRIFNLRQQRNWRETHLALKFRPKKIKTNRKKRNDDA